jgi:flagellar biogenesis protein FliO
VEILQPIAAMVFVFALLGGALWWLRSRNMVAFGPARQGTSKMQVIDRVRLTPQHSIHILRTGKRELTIAVHPSGCTLLDTRTAEEAER